MKIKDFSAVKYYSKKLGKHFHAHTTFGEMSNWKKVMVKKMVQEELIVFIQT